MSQRVLKKLLSASAIQIKSLLSFLLVLFSNRKMGSHGWIALFKIRAWIQIVFVSSNISIQEEIRVIISKGAPASVFIPQHLAYTSVLLECSVPRSTVDRDHQGPLSNFLKHNSFLCTQTNQIWNKCKGSNS